MKPFWKSKTLWVNLIAALAFFLQKQLGFVLPPEYQAILLSLVNFLLRFSTSEPIVPGLGTGN